MSNVQISTVEGMPWLISVTNGLNGQKTDDFKGRKISVEKNIDLSEAL